MKDVFHDRHARGHTRTGWLETHQFVPEDEI